MYSYQKQRQESLSSLSSDISQALQQLKYEAQKANPEDTYFAITLDGTFIYHSSKIKSLRGYSPEEANQKPIEKSITPNSLNQICNIFHEEELKPMYERWKLRSAHVEMYTACGSVVLVEAFFEGIKDGVNNVLAIKGRIHEINNFD